MTLPAPAQQISALSALAGWQPDPSMRRNFAMVLLITRAKERGVTWNAIATAVGADNGKAAKAYAKRLAKGCQSALLSTAVQRLTEGSEVGE